jgi:hypothetical protein
MQIVGEQDYQHDRLQKERWRGIGFDRFPANQPGNALPAHCPDIA